MNMLSSQEEEDEVVRCRRVREKLDKRFNTVDKAFARLEELAQSRKRRGVARTQKRSRPTAKNTKSAHRKADSKV